MAFVKSTRPTLSVDDWNLLNRLLQQALELDGEAQATWLRNLPAESAHINALVAELLVESATGTPGTNEPGLAAVAKVASAALAAMRRDQPGDRIGPWQLVRMLAEGGMGTVWVARRADGVMQRTVALKLPRAEWVDPGLSERIARERAILARLQHPHIAVLYDAGVDVDGRPYLALEYVDGIRIDEYCKAHGVDAILRLFVRVVRAVAYAHAQLVIHRDLKPANVLVTADGTPKLLDFGISKLMKGDGPNAGDTALTGLADRALTLAYAAPEQVLGQPISVAADVYTLGVMLFELLSGQRPFAGTDPRALEAAILAGDPARPGERTVDKARARALRGDLDAIVLTAVKRDPGKRYRSADALADDLDNFLAGRPVTARPDSSFYRLRKFVTRNKLPVAAGTAVIVALGFGLLMALWQAERATALNSFLLSLIRQTDPNVSQQTRTADLAMLGSIEDKIDREFKGSPDQLLQLRLTVGNAYRNRGEMMAARRAFQRAADDAAPHLADDNLMLLTARVRASDYNLIASTAASGQLDTAIAILRRKGPGNSDAADLLIDALLIRQELQNAYGLPAFLPAERRLDTFREANAVAVRSFGEGSRQQLRVVVPALGWMTFIEGRTAARQMLEPMLKHARQRGDGTSAGIEYLLANASLSALNCADGVRQAESLLELRKAIEVVRVAHDPTSVLLEELQLLLGQCNRATGAAGGTPAEFIAYDIAVARERPPSTNIMRRASGAFDAAMGTRDLALAARYYQIIMDNAGAIPEAPLRERLTTLARIGRVCLLAGQGEDEAAVRAAASLIADFNAVYEKIGRLTPRQGELWTCLSKAQRQQGHHEAALQTLQTFVDRIRTTPLSPQIMLTQGEGAALIERTLVELDAGMVAAAQATIEARLAMSRDMAMHPTYALAYGRVLLATGRAGEAVEPLRKFHETWVSLQPDSPYTAEALFWLGRVYQEIGDPRGRAMVAQARKSLAGSPVQSHRRLAVDKSSG